MASSLARSICLARPVARTIVPKMAPRGVAPFRSFSGTSFNLDRKYTKNHEWIEISADQKSGTVGISTYAADQLGDVVYVELPEVSSDVSASDAFGVVESVKSASDIYAPVAGTVKIVNTELAENPGRLSTLPEDDSAGGGWIARLELSEASQTDAGKLMSAEEYKAYCEEEGH